jgi:TnpA family transposase
MDTAPSSIRGHDARSLLIVHRATKPVFSMPTDPTEMVRHYTLGADDIVLIRTKRRSINRFGFAIQLCLLKYPGLGMGPVEQPPEAMIAFVAHQLGVPVADFADYAQRDQTRREHAVETIPGTAALWTGRLATLPTCRR